jgi:DNA-binding IclR family transcriptional regulator
MHMKMLPDSRALAFHVLRAVARPRVRAVTLADVARAVGARRADVRRVVTRLHQEGYVDALRMRPTLAGLALATASRASELAGPGARSAVADVV